MPVIPPLSQLLNAQTPAQIESTLLSFLAAAGLPSSNWAATSVPSLMVESSTKVLGAFQQQIVTLGNAGYFQLASQSSLQTGPGGTSPWVDLGAQQFYNNLRQQPQAVNGSFSFTTSALAGPYNIIANQLKITDATGNVFKNTGAFTIPKNGTVIAQVQALSPGSQANIVNGTPLTLSTSLAGVTVSTSPAMGSPLWYMTGQAGTDIESDQSLIARCLNQWPGQGTGSPVGAWINWIFAASNEVRYVKVQATGYGAEKITVWGNDGPVSNTGLINITSYVNPRIPNSIFIAPGSPQNAGVIPINPASGSGNYATMNIVLYGPQSAQVGATAAAISALALLVQITPLGGYPIAPGAPDTYGVSNAFFVAACRNANSSITRVDISVTNYVNGSAILVPSGPGTDLIMTPTAGVPAALQTPPTEDSTGWQIQWISV